MSNQSIEAKLLIIIDKLKSIENRLSTIEDFFIIPSPQTPIQTGIIDLLEEDEEILYKPSR